MAVIRPGFIYGERDRTVLPKLLVNLRRGSFAYFGSGEQALNCIYVKNLVHGLFLAAENPAAVGEIFNMTDGETVSKTRFVSRVAELAGLKPPSRHIPLWLARVLATVVEKGAKLRGAKNPPIINKARFKFLGLNLDYSIEKGAECWLSTLRTVSSKASSGRWPSTAPAPSASSFRLLVPTHDRGRDMITFPHPRSKSPEEQHDDRSKRQARGSAG